MITGIKAKTATIRERLVQAENQSNAAQRAVIDAHARRAHVGEEI